MVRPETNTKFQEKCAGQNGPSDVFCPKVFYGSLKYDASSKKHCSTNSTAGSDLSDDQAGLSDYSCEAYPLSSEAMNLSYVAVPVATAQKMQMPPPPQNFEKVVDTPVTANCPTDFASAWNAAANVSGWKREEPAPNNNKKGQTQKNGPAQKNENGQKQNAARKIKNQPAKIAAKPKEVVDMPMPKWCSAANSTVPAPPGLTMPMEMPMKFEGSLADLIGLSGVESAKVEPACQAFRSDLAFGFAVGHGIQPPAGLENLELPIPGFCQTPLTLAVPKDDWRSTSILNKAIPCKKTVPVWSF